MEDSQTKLTELQFRILDGMADDYEDVEQMYLYANREFAQEKEGDVQFPNIVLRVGFPLRDIVDEIATLLREGYIEAKHSNDEQLAPLSSLDLTLLHHYWFGPTERGRRAWEAHSTDESQNG